MSNEDKITKDIVTLQKLLLELHNSQCKLRVTLQNIFLGHLWGMLGLVGLCTQHWIGAGAALLIGVFMSRGR